MKKDNLYFNLTVIILICFLSFSFISASFINGNVSSNVLDKYGYGDLLKGWINISFQAENFSSLITAFDSNITLKDLLDKNSLHPKLNYNCTSLLCQQDYILTSNNALSSISLTSGESKVVGFKITDTTLISDVAGIKLNFTSDALDSCLPQLVLDIADQYNTTDYVSDKQSTSFCSTPNYGCYVYLSSNQQTQMRTNEYYCEMINISASSALKLGADIYGSGYGAFEFIEMNNQKNCIVNITSSAASSNTISCNINLTVYQPTQLNVCVRETSGSYSLFYEQDSPCGYVGTLGSSPDYDFSIYAQPLKFAALKEVFINSSSLTPDLYAYLNWVYGADCSKGCYVPIKLYSGANQTLKINDASFDYNVVITKKATSLYSFQSYPSLIDSGFLQINLSNSGLRVPNSSGVYNLSLNLNNEVILNKSIEVLSLPVINSLSPLEVPAAGEMSFTADVSGYNITSYTWNFGDNTTVQTTTVNNVKHKYPSITKYSLSLTVQNIYGSVTKNFTINATSPKDYLNNTLSDYRNAITTMRAQINSFPTLVKSYIEEKLNLSAFEIQIVGFQTRFDSAGSDDNVYISILNSLTSLSLPKNITVKAEANGDFVIDKSKINIGVLENLSSSRATDNESKVKEEILSWFIKSLNVNADLKVYYFVYSNSSSPSFSYVNLKLTPKTIENMNNVYGVITYPSDKVRASGITLSNIDNNVGFTLDLSSEKNIELIIADKFNLIELPIYFSPQLSTLKGISNIGICNNNGICESTKGENSNNCRNDCKPWGLALIYLVILIIIFFVLYILIQEWYKRKYEDHLFKDKNDLTNLIMFIANSEKQGKDKSEIIPDLKEKKWDHEQIDYAYRKYKGERTGMFEIPIFSIFEKKKVEQQIEASNQNMNNQASLTTPKPKVPFVRPQNQKDLFNNSISSQQNKQNINKL